MQLTSGYYPKISDSTSAESPILISDIDLLHVLKYKSQDNRYLPQECPCSQPRKDQDTQSGLVEVLPL